VKGEINYHKNIGNLNWKLQIKNMNLVKLDLFNLEGTLSTLSRNIGIPDFYFQDVF
jgi:hypothetical protein